MRQEELGGFRLRLTHPTHCKNHNNGRGFSFKLTPRDILVFLQESVLNPNENGYRSPQPKLEEFSKSTPAGRYAVQPIANRM
jgi:hypothetical protein